MATLGELGEKRIISEVIRKMSVNKQAVIPLHDDAQVFPQEMTSSLQWVISTDRTPSNLRAFEWGLMSHREYGRYCVVSNVSDVVAMGAKPYGFLLNIAAPRSMKLSDFKEVMNGVSKALDEYSICLMGGDTKEGEQLNLVGISLGQIEFGKSLRRNGAIVGDTLAISESEPIGLAPGAFLFFKKKHLFKSSEIERLEPIFRSVLIDVRARAEEATALLEWSSCNSLIDNSDGVYESARELASASNLDIELSIDLDDIHPATIEVASTCSVDPVVLALSGGADFRLLFSSSEMDSCPIDIREIGKTSPSSIERGRVITNGIDSTDRIQGWVHFNN